MDAASVIRYALSKMSSLAPNIFKQIVRDGRIINNGSELLDCDADPVKQWKHGYDVMKHMHEVIFYLLEL